MSWGSVIEWVLWRRCDERRRYGSCGCRSGRKGAKYNPCQRAEEVAAACEAQGRGDMPITAIVKWMWSKNCHLSRGSQACNHRGCVHGESLIQFVESHDKAAAA